MVSLLWSEQWPTDSDWDLRIQAEWLVYCGVNSDLTYRSRLRPTHSDWMVSLLWSEQWPDLQIQTETYTFRLRPTDPYWDLKIQTEWSVYCGVSSHLQIQTKTYRLRLNGQFIVEYTDPYGDLQIQTKTYRFTLRPTDSDWDLQIHTKTYRFRPNGQLIVEWAVTYRFRLRATRSHWTAFPNTPKAQKGSTSQHSKSWGERDCLKAVRILARVGKDSNVHLQHWSASMAVVYSAGAANVVLLVKKCTQTHNDTHAHRHTYVTIHTHTHTQTLTPTHPHTQTHTPIQTYNTNTHTLISKHACGVQRGYLH